MQNFVLKQIGFLDHPAFVKALLAETVLLDFSLKTAISHHFTH